MLIDIKWNILKIYSKGSFRSLDIHPLLENEYESSPIILLVSILLVDYTKIKPIRKMHFININDIQKHIMPKLHRNRHYIVIILSERKHFVKTKRGRIN